MNKKVLKFLGIILICLFGFNITVFADSGWDSDYSGGGFSSSSWDFDSGYSSSSWDHDYSSSSWDRDSSYSGSGGSYSKIENDPIFVFVVSFGVLIVILVMLLPDKKYSYPGVNHDSVPLNKNILNNYYGYSDMDEELFKKFIPNVNFEAIKQKTYKTFVEIQEAWMDFNYDKLSLLCADELYNSYKNELEVLSLKKQKNIMHSFNFNTCNIVNCEKRGKEVLVKVMLSTTFYDYVIDNRGVVVRGNPNMPLTNVYELVFKYNEIKLDSKRDICPNCGAKIPNNTHRCSYCNSYVKDISSELVLVTKKRQI